MKLKIGKGGGELRERLAEAKRAKRAERSRGVTRRAKAGRGGKIGVGIFLGFFLLAGLGFGYFMFGRPLLEMWDARDWPGVPCVITSSSVSESRGDDGTTYRVAMTFRYEYNGRSYSADRYDFFSSMHSSGYQGKKDVVNRYPPGKEAMCYVNPADPSVAVIHRGGSHNLWFGLIPLVFILIGGGGTLGLIWSGRREDWATRGATRSDDKPSRREDWLPELAQRQTHDAGSARLSPGDTDVVSPTRSRLGKALGVLVFMLIWDGITGFMLYQVFSGNAPWGVGLFMIPFVLVGLGFFVGFVYMLLSLSNPVVRMSFTPRVVELGQTLQLDWTIDGRADRIRKLTVTVEGLERASYTRGTDTITDEHVFFEHTLFESEAPDRRDPLARDGSAELDLPADTMHSLDADHNKIIWRVKVHGDIPKWPDVKDEYEFAVIPATGASRRGMF